LDVRVAVGAAHPARSAAPDIEAQPAGGVGRRVPAPPSSGQGGRGAGGTPVAALRFRTVLAIQRKPSPAHNIPSDASLHRSATPMITPLVDHQPRFPDPSRRPGIGIVGCGGIVRGAHLPAYTKYGLRVVGVYDV